MLKVIKTSNDLYFIVFVKTNSNDIFGYEFCSIDVRVLGLYAYFLLIVDVKSFN